MATGFEKRERQARQAQYVRDKAIAKAWKDGDTSTAQGRRALVSAIDKAWDEYHETMQKPSGR